MYKYQLRDSQKTHSEQLVSVTYFSGDVVKAINPRKEGEAAGLNT